MNTEAVAWMLVDEINGDYMLEKHPSGDYDWIPLYTHPHPDNLGLAESIIKQQQAEIEALKIKLAEAVDAEKDRRFE